MSDLRAYFGEANRVTIPEELTDETYLLTYLGVGERELNKIRYYGRRMYRHFSLAKSPNKLRLISAAGYQTQIPPTETC